MAKTQAAKMTDTFETIKPYLERALKDDEFRQDLKDALLAARELYGPLTKGNGVAGSARVLATDKKAQEHLRRALDDLTSAAGTLQGSNKKKSHKGRKMLLLAGVVALNVAVLRLNVRLDELAHQRANVRAANAALSAQVSSATATAQVETLAARGDHVTIADVAAQAFGIGIDVVGEIRILPMNLGIETIEDADTIAARDEIVGRVSHECPRAGFGVTTSGAVVLGAGSWPPMSSRKGGYLSVISAA